MPTISHIIKEHNLLQKKGKPHLPLSPFSTRFMVVYFCFKINV